MEKDGGSRLMQMQARYQQKQMQEREMKIANLYESQQARALDRVRHSPSNGVQQSPSNGSKSISHGSNGISNGSIRSNGSVNSPPQAVAHQPGKVRQMFEERRTKAGIDKSYPLQPIHNTERTRKALPTGYPKVPVTSRSTPRVTENKLSTKTLATKTQTSISQQNIKKVTKVHRTDNLVNGSGDLNHNHKPDLNSKKQALPQSSGEEPHSIDEEKNENYLLEDETFPETLAPVATPRSPEPSPRPEIKAPPRRNPELRNRNNATKPKPQPPISPRRANAVNTGSASTRAKGAMQKGATPAQSTIRRPILQSRDTGSAKSQTSAANPAASSGPACSVCGRHFASDRIAKHEDICKKAHAKKRKPYDVLKHRLAGTEAEPFIGKLRKSTTNPSSTKQKPLNSTWRQKHTEFIQAIRAAKQVQAHLASGGKLSDLPPPPPSENPDYVACPHCGRRFNQGAADRHIPKCKDYQFNKPKPAAKRR